MALVLSGDGSITGNPNITLTESVSIAGTVTYEDVTNIDSIGIVTARSGINVTGGSLDVQGNATITGTLVASNGNITSEVDLTGISSSISDTAVDVFVYDTSKDSDGGAWRKRTQHTSWYNETLNTSTRGSRKEFPAVAVIVVDSTFDLTIYDGDDPDLPMWMKFENSGFLSWSTNGDCEIKTVSMLNGIFVTGGDDGDGGIHVNFVSDHVRTIFGNGNKYDMTGAAPIISNRSATVGFLNNSGGDGIAIVNTNINDVAMTVLPNAPVDSATGLPVPTIAVATNGGPSVIKDDGTVVNYNRGGNEYTGSVAFDDLDDLIISWGTSVGGYRHATRITNPFVGTSSLDSTYGYIASDTGLGGSAAGNTNGVVTVANSGRHFGIDFDSSSGVPATQGNYDDRVDFLHINDADTTKSLVAFVNSSYNTGWMHGSIKGAFLSDTNTSHPEIIVNGTFDSNVSGWSSFNSVLSHQTDAIRVADNGSWSKAYQSFTTVVGRVYSVKITIKTISGNAAYAYAGAQNPAQTAGNDTTIFASITSTGTYYGLFTATATTSYIEVTSDSTSYVEYSEISVKEAVQDRSVNNNGLQVIGTVTKTAVATGADLVAYSGFSASNYLQQPYNSDLDFGTGDFSVIGWVKKNGNSNKMFIDNRKDGNNAGFSVESNSNGTVRFRTKAVGSGTESLTNTTTTIADNIWHCIVAVVSSSGTNHKIYIDGVLDVSVAVTPYSVSTGSNELYFGIAGGFGAIPLDDGSLALWRISATIPSPEQVKKMYEDEKVLFQENAKATLYGSSDAVTALAYDEVTDQLHVGTSDGRSDFQGLRRINNTTTAVTTAISAHDTFIIEQ